MTIVAPSVLSLDYSHMEKQIQQLNESAAEWLHFDVMDGHFVPNLTFGTDIMKGFAKSSRQKLDVHVMIEDPVAFMDSFYEAGAYNYTFHEEALMHKEEIAKLAAHAHELGKSVGLSIKPGTPLEYLKPWIGKFDLFLLMSVEPGFGGQKFQPAVLDRIRTLRKWLMEEGSTALIEVDGGINAETGKQCVEAGADVLVAGSYVFKNDIRKAVHSLV